MRRLVAALAALMVASAPGLATARAVAQDSSAKTQGAHFSGPEAADFSKQIERDLAARGARLALVFRAGRTRDALPEGISYTHGAFWAYSDIQTTAGERANGYAVHNLYAGGGDGAWPTTESRLIQDFPIEFIDGSTVDDVGIIIPAPELQRRILAVMASPAYRQLHNPAYTLVANPFERKYQNCNTFMLDVIAAAAWETSSPAQIKANLRAHFQPAVIPANGFQRLFGPIVDGRLRTDDHRGPIRTATYESMAAFLERNGMLQEAYVLNFSRN